MRAKPFLGAVLLFLSASAAFGVNLLTNPTFDTGLQGWSTLPNANQTTDWDSQNAAARIRWSGPTTANSFSSGLKQAVSGSAGSVYTYGAKVNATSRGLLFLDFGDASGKPIGSGASIQITTGLRTYTQTVTTPAGTAFVAIRFAIEQINGAVLLIDDAVIDGPPPPRPTISFTASPSSITAGQSSTLSWSVQNATTVVIDNGIGTVPLMGSRSVSPPRTTTFKLVATGPGGSDFKQVTIDVQGQPLPTIVSFTALPQTIQSGAMSTLGWITRDATSVSIDNGVGQVGTSGTIAVTPPATTTYTLTATNTTGRVLQQTTVTLTPTRPQIEFRSNPPLIQQGQSSTLTWSTTNATSVFIDNGIGMQPPSGSAVVTPSDTTSYTLTATGPGGEFKKRTTVFVNLGMVPIVVVSHSPNGMVSIAGRPATDRYTLTNLGRASTTITLSQQGTFFTQSPTAFTLLPGATQVVTITAMSNALGPNGGASIPSGDGVRQGLVIRVKLFVAPPPVGTPNPSAPTRFEIADVADRNPSGLVTFTNDGTDTLQGIAVSDQPWLIPDDSPVTIPAGGSAAVKFSIDRSLRPDSGALNGAAYAKLSVVYLSTTAPAALAGDGYTASDGSNTTTFSITLVDIVTPGATPGSPPPLSAGELAVFASGIPQRTDLVGDMLISTIETSVPDLKLFLAGTGLTSLTNAIDELPANASLALPSVVKNTFGSSAAGGTVQVRTSTIDKLSVSAVQTNTTYKFGSYITALPTFRSDRALGAEQSLYLTGVEKSSSRQTNLVVQETAGSIAAVQIDFLDASGAVISARPPDAIASFEQLSITDAAPTGTSAIRVTNTSTNAAKVVAYALVNSTVVQDAWVITDPTISGATTSLFVPLLPTTTSLAIADNDLYVMNTGSVPIDITTDTIFPTALRRRAVRSTSLSSGLLPQPDASTTTTVAPLQTVRITIDSLNTGFLRVSGSGPFVASARSTLNGALRPGPFGTALPVMASEAMSTGQKRRFSGVDDSSDATVAAGTAVTYRTNLGLLETTGQSAVVRLTMRYVYSAGVRVTATGQSTLDVTVAPGQMQLMKNLSSMIIGSARATYGDLHNMQLDVEVISGNGRVIPFLQTIDNGSGDSSIRTE